MKTIEDMKEAASEELFLLQNEKIKYEQLSIEAFGKINILYELELYKKFFIIIKLMESYKSENETLSKIINIFFNILKENSCENQEKNIGVKVNKYNYEKYISCRNQLLQIEDLLRGTIILEVISDNLKSTFNIKSLIMKVKDNIKDFTSQN